LVFIKSNNSNSPNIYAGKIIMTNPTIETDIAEVLKSLQQGQEKLIDQIGGLNNDLNSLKVNLEEFKGEMRTSQARLEEKFDAQAKIVAGLESSQNKQIWALIALAFTAVVSLLVGLGKFIFFPNP